MQVVLSYSKPWEGGVGETLLKWDRQGLGGGEETSFGLSPSFSESSLHSTDRLFGLRTYINFTEGS